MGGECYSQERADVAVPRCGGAVKAGVRARACVGSLYEEGGGVSKGCIERLGSGVERWRSVEVASWSPSRGHGRGLWSLRSQVSGLWSLVSGLSGLLSDRVRPRTQSAFAVEAAADVQDEPVGLRPEGACD